MRLPRPKLCLLDLFHCNEYEFKGKWIINRALTGNIPNKCYATFVTFGYVTEIYEKKALSRERLVSFISTDYLKRLKDKLCLFLVIDY